MTIDDSKIIYFPDPDKRDPDPHSYGEEGKLMASWTRKVLHSSKEMSSQSTCTQCFEQICVTQFIGMALGTNLDKSLWRMLSSQHILHQGVDTEYALWFSLWGKGKCVFSGPEDRKRICSTKVGVGYTLSLSECLARWMTWRQLHLWKGSCEQGNNSRKMLSWVNCMPCN